MKNKNNKNYIIFGNAGTKKTGTIENIEVKNGTPDKETEKAMLEAEMIAKDPSVKGYTDMVSLIADLEK